MSSEKTKDIKTNKSKKTGKRAPNAAQLSLNDRRELANFRRFLRLTPHYFEKMLTRPRWQHYLGLSIEEAQQFIDLQRREVFVPKTVETRTIEEMIRESASKWVQAHARACVFDNPEDIETETCWQHTFDYLRQGTQFKETDIVDYLLKNCPEAIRNAKNAVESEAETEGINPIDWKHTATQFCKGKCR